MLCADEQQQGCRALEMLRQGYAMTPPTYVYGVDLGSCKGRTGEP